MQLDGKIIAPTSPSAWGRGTLQWLEFTKLNKITIKGKGVIDGQGSIWWNDSEKLPKTKPTVRIFLALFYLMTLSVSNIIVESLKIFDFNHIYFKSYSSNRHKKIVIYR